jgi:hypothetical protein
MATAPQPAQPSVPQGDPTGTSAQTPDDASDAQGAYEICIKVGADGSLSVGVEQEGQEAAPGAEGAEDDDSGFQPAQSIKDALTMALEIYKSNGGAPTNNADMASQFKAGFGGQ